MPKPASKDQPKQLRSPFAWPIGLVTAVIGFLFFASALTASHGKPSLASMGFGVLVMAGAYLFGIRPGISLRADGIDIRNPVHTVFLPWTSVGELKSADVLIVSDTAGRTTRCYAISGSLRSLTRVQKAETEVRERMERELEEGTSDGLPFYGITTATYVGLAALTISIVITIYALLSGLRK